MEPSKYPGAGSYRIANVARFTTGCKTFTLINTHLDDISDDQRQLGASMILTRAKYEAVQSNGPVFVTGDFNRYSIVGVLGQCGINNGVVLLPATILRRTGSLQVRTIFSR